MYIVANLATSSVEGTVSTPASGDSTVSNGKFFVAVPEGVGIEVDSTSALSPQASTLPGDIASELLVRFPMYDHVLWNFFLEDTDIAALDLSSGAPQPTAATVSTGVAPTMVPGPVPRCRVGRGTGPAPVGIAPNSVAILAANPHKANTNFGCLITDTEDLTPYTGAGGTDEVFVWWKIASASTSEDTLNGYGPTSNQNIPALRSLLEIPQEPANFYCYASVDDGVTWHEARYMEPTDLIAAGTDLRIAFVNQRDEDVYLLGFAVLFPDIP